MSKSPSSLDHKRAIELLVAIEQQFDVNSIQYKGLKIWPLIRIHLGDILVNPNLHKVNSPTKSKTRGTYHLGAIKNIAGDILLARRWKTILQAIEINRGVDVALYSMPEYYTDILNNRFYNRHLDPMIEHLSKSEKYLKLEIYSDQTQSAQPRFYPTIMLDFGPFAASSRLQKRIDFGKKRFVIAGMYPFIAAIYKMLGENLVTSEQIYQQLEQFYLYTSFFCQVLTVLRPKVLFLTTFYGRINMALVYAAKQLGITTVDIQHGKQGKYHPAYNHWTRIPDNGYELIPDYFWVWGAESKRNILQTREEKPKHHIPLIGGNLWLAKWVHHRDNYQPSPAVSNFYQQLTSTPKVILVSLQPLYPILPDIVKQTIQQSPTDWLWLIRLHPLTKHQQNEINHELVRHGASNFEIECATSEPLYALLQHVDHHVTAFSTVCYEALTFKVPTTLFGSEANDLYQDYITLGIFRYAQNPDEMLTSISSAQFVPEEHPYIIVDDQQADAAIDFIMGRTKQL